MHENTLTPSNSLSVFAWLVVFAGVLVALSLFLVAEGLIRHRRQTFTVAFVAANAALLGEAALTVSFSYCNDKHIEGDKFMGMKFISTRLLQCKYSDKPECFILPPMLILTVMVVTIQLHYTLHIVRFPETYLVNLLCYLQVLGFSGVVLFDSMTVSAKNPREAWHAGGVVVLCLSSWVLHWITWEYIRTNLLQSDSALATVLETLHSSEYVYFVCLVLFLGLFLAQSQLAITVEYAVLFFFLLLSMLNLWIQHQVHCAPFLSTTTQTSDQPVSVTHGVLRYSEWHDPKPACLALVLGLISIGIVIIMYVTSLVSATQ